MTIDPQRLPERARMVQEQLRRRGIADEGVLAAMHEVPREAFVPPEHRSRAYADSALPIGHGQTISQPYMVARALELARVPSTGRALEVGLGSGYQAAVLSKLCKRVIGIERVPELAERARDSLHALGFENIDVITADGSHGYPQGAPYDAILVAAGAPGIPHELVDQLAIGGRLVIPVGSESMQVLRVCERSPTGIVESEHEACVYVPLLGASGFRPS